MITLSKGKKSHRFEYMVASGALSYGFGYPHEKYFWRFFPMLFNPLLFTTVTKTLTYGREEGNFKMYWPWGCIRPISKDGKKGFVNAVALTNPGIFWWCDKIGPKVDRKKIPIIVSIRADTKDQLEQMIKWIEPLDVVGIELNDSCPNIKDKDGIGKNTERTVEKCKLIHRMSSHPLVLKISVLHDVETLIPLIRDYVSAITINSVLWDIVFPGITDLLGRTIVSGRKSPLAHLGGGGVSGEVAQDYTWPLMERIVKIGTVPVAGPSPWHYKDLGELRKRGADAIAFGSLHLRNYVFPFAPTRYVLREIKEIANQRENQLRSPWIRS